jgi:hypothetical protein
MLVSFVDQISSTNGSNPINYDQRTILRQGFFDRLIPKSDSYCVFLILQMIDNQAE